MRPVPLARRARTKGVPDPFFGAPEGFDHAFDLIEQAARGLLASLTADEAQVKREA